MKILDYKDEFFFGKYKGYTVEEVIEKNPSYIVWVIVNVDFCSFVEGTYKKACSKIEPTRYYRRSRRDYNDSHPMWEEHQDHGTIIGINGH